jgi:8-oxo-dGTP pyrophosphatase MutT (NUDIX family)
VALIHVPSPDAILVIHRATRTGDPWSGQMGLPGGHVELEDQDFVATAIRETSEEVGIGLDRSDLVGPLDDVAPKSVTPPPFLVRPFLFTLADRPPLRLSSEVVAATWVEWSALADPAHRREVTITIGGQPRSVAAFVIDGQVIWGMTERVLAPLVAVVGEV